MCFVRVSRSGSSGPPVRRQDSRGVPASPMRRNSSTGAAASKHSKPGREGQNEALQLARQMSAGNLRSSGEKRRGMVDRPSTPPADLLGEEEVQKKTEALVAEYLSVRDLEEAKQCVLELKSPGQHHNVVVTIVNHVLERKPEDRAQAAHLLQSLAHARVLTPDQCHAG